MVALALNLISAHYQGRPVSNQSEASNSHAESREAYIVQSRPTVSDRDDLQRSVLAIDNAQIRGQGPFRNADGAVPRLVQQHGVEGDVERADVGSEAQVERHVGPGVVEVDDQAAAIKRPQGSVVVGRIGGVDVGACPRFVSHGNGRDEERTGGGGRASFCTSTYKGTDTEMRVG